MENYNFNTVRVRGLGKMRKKNRKTGLTVILFCRTSPKIFPEKVFQREIFPANLKGPAKIIKELDHLQSVQANLYTHSGVGARGGETESNPYNVSAQIK